MIDEKSSLSDKFHITQSEFDRLIAYKKNPESRNKAAVFMIGVLLGVSSVIGALLGFVRAYNRFFRHKAVPPAFYPMAPITRVAIGIGVVLSWLLTTVLLWVAYKLIIWGGFEPTVVIAYLAGNALLTCLVFVYFNRWEIGVKNGLLESNKFGSARFASEDELESLKTPKGFYIGQGLYFNDKGHLLTVAGTRGGKGTNIIIPNLLGAGDIDTSWVVIDPKGENAAITANYQRSKGKNVVILNPWDLLREYVGPAQGYNPLDMLANNRASPHLVDDVQMIAEMIVPIEPHSNKDPFWTDSARTIISGLLLHLVTSQKREDCTLTTLWKWARLFGDDWDKLVQEMGTNDDPVNGVVVRNAANEILKLSAAGEETFGSIISSVLQSTDFLKSPSLQKSLESSFNPDVLVDYNTTVYIIIPADKLRSHSRWLRLVVTSMLRAVIRQPKNRVTFMLDEFAALGYLPEIETALSTYAGYNVTVWPILQTLIQLHAQYGENWQSFIANCTVRQYFSINDNYSAEYISKAIGETSHTIITKSWLGTKGAQANARALITPDELRRESGKKIFMFVGDLPPTYVDKLPYYLVPEWNNRADNNPYIN